MNMSDIETENPTQFCMFLVRCEDMGLILG
jgi:hypothetical protein